MDGITIGADPELFLCDGSGNPVSAIGRIGGSKRKPRLIRDDGCAVQEDNVAVEFNIPPCDSVEKFVETINFNLEYLRKHVQTQQLKLDIKASAVFPDKELDNRKAREFGCDPDFNAWTGNRNPRPSASDPNLRSSGGHVHIAAPFPPQLLARSCDLFIGVPSVLLDSDTQRRQLYGRAGTYRPKRYGVEYRTPSNFWIKNDDLIRWMFGASHQAVQFTEHGMEEYDYLEGDSARIQECINTSNQDLALKIMVDYGVPLP